MKFYMHKRIHIAAVAGFAYHTSPCPYAHVTIFVVDLGSISELSHRFWVQTITFQEQKESSMHYQSKRTGIHKKWHDLDPGIPIFGYA